jgi:hypothetical protein
MVLRKLGASILFGMCGAIPYRHVRVSFFPGIHFNGNICSKDGRRLWKEASSNDKLTPGNTNISCYFLFRKFIIDYSTIFHFGNGWSRKNYGGICLCGRDVF